MGDGLGFIGGFLIGAAGSVHCIGICGGIAASLFLASGYRDGPKAAAVQALGLQIGRVATYVILGAAAGSGAGATAALFDLASANAVLRSLSAASLVLSGLSIAGIVPAPGRLILARVRASSSGCARGRYAPVPIVMGMAWGLAPCGMVYSALLTATFSGSSFGGAVFMLGFGSATVPALTLALFGTAASAARWRNASRLLRRPMGWGLVLVGLLSLLEPAMRIGALCSASPA
ncbi:sulfite exporter TauE/SafE family protein [Aureimonas sp. Leaf454]|uniref:sulfite exporter TauE/SafE family protein n=1 Tax=Aureimonas sp. Leaf454 TaxID=1736381 RepID=UPI000B113365|nr:sulfite exporter TauE/SafE family protein [Aureimonas sp. Leaf454]